MTTGAGQTVDTRDMIVVHKAVRREYKHAPALVESAAPGDTVRAAAVAEHLDLMNNFLHHHHIGEDRLLWPKLLDRVPAEVAPFVALMETQHQAVHELMETSRSQLAGWRSDPSAENRAALADTLSRLYIALDEHLNAEEQHILPLASQYLTPGEWGALGEEGMAALEKKHLPLILGMFMYEGDPSVISNMLSHAPMLPRLVMPFVAPRTYRRYARRLYGAELS